MKETHIDNKTDHRRALKRVEHLWQAKPKTVDGDALVSLIEAYDEEANFLLIFVATSRFR